MWDTNQSGPVYLWISASIADLTYYLLPFCSQTWTWTRISHLRMIFLHRSVFDCVCLKIQQAFQILWGYPGYAFPFSTRISIDFVAVLAQNKYKLAAKFPPWLRCSVASCTQTRLKQRSIAPKSSTPSWNDMALRTWTVLGVWMSHCSEKLWRSICFWSHKGSAPLFCYTILR